MPPPSVAVFSFYTDLIQTFLLSYPSVLLLLFYFAPLGINRQQRIIVLKHVWALTPNLRTPTRTPSPPLSPTLSSSPWGQPSVPSGLKSPIMSTGSYALPPSLRPPLSHQSNRPPFPCLPHPGPSPQNCGHQSRRVRQPVLMEHGVRATLKAAEDEASRDRCLSSLFFFLCLSLPFFLSG